MVKADHIYSIYVQQHEHSSVTLGYMAKNETSSGKDEDRKENKKDKMLCRNASARTAAGYSLAL